MKIHVVTVTSGWILQRLANELAASAGYTCSDVPRDDAEVNYYFDFLNCFQGRSGGGKQVAFFPHFHEDSAEYVKKYQLQRLKQLDGVVCMCQRYFKRLEDMLLMVGARTQVICLRPGNPAAEIREKKPKIGILQRGGVGTAHQQNTGHPGKGHDFMLQMVETHTEEMRRFEWTFVGQGWRQVVEAMVAQSIEVYWREEPNKKFLHGSQTVLGLYEGHLHNMDYILVPSLWEGGPMIIPQALAAGVPVISADVGWANEFPEVDLFKPGDHEALRNILAVNSHHASRKAVESITWENYQKKLEAFCADL